VLSCRFALVKTEKTVKKCILHKEISFFPKESAAGSRDISIKQYNTPRRNPRNPRNPHNPWTAIFRLTLPV
jgi:hypothetical protein